MLTAFAGTSEIAVKLVGLAVTMSGNRLVIAMVSLQYVVIRTFGWVRSLPFAQGASGASQPGLCRKPQLGRQLPAEFAGVGSSAPT